LVEVLLSARRIVEIARLLFLRTAKRKKRYPGGRLIGRVVLTSQTEPLFDEDYLVLSTSSRSALSIRAV
jgi:hypothetical protein